MANKSLTIGELSPEAVFSTLQTKGLTATEATSFIGSWLLATVGQTKRTFNFTGDFPVTDPNCASTFARTFVHEDWQDGISTVQASETPGELGFNSRFHLIEKDIDALAANLAGAFTCLATMRRSVFDLLQEIRVELNRIDTDLDNCCNKKTSTAPGVSQTFGTGAFLGYTKVNNAQMQLWQTSAGVMMLPDISVLKAEAWNNPRASRAGQLTRFVAEHPEVAQAFPQAVSTQEFVKNFGARQLPDGTFVRDLVGSLPANSQFSSLDAMMADVSDREAAALRTTEGARQAIATSLGVHATEGVLSESKLENFGALATPVREVLLKNGISTLGKFADLPPQRALELLRKDGVATAELSDLAEASGIAKTLLKVG